MERRRDDQNKNESDCGQAKQAFEMAAKQDNDKRDSSVSAKGIRSMSVYSSQFLDVAKSSDYALFCLTETNPIRKLSKYVVESKYPFYV